MLFCELQVQFLLGRQGPAQCLNMTNGPMKIYLVPRNGDKPIVSILLSSPAIYAEDKLAFDVLQERCKVAAAYLLLQPCVLLTGCCVACVLQELSCQAAFCDSCCCLAAC